MQELGSHTGYAEGARKLCRIYRNPNGMHVMRELGSYAANEKSEYSKIF
jgi:hypothetical protein